LNGPSREAGLGHSLIIFPKK